MSLREPPWWAEAREMRERGLTLHQIGRKLGKSTAAILYATDPEFRERKRQGDRARYHARVQG